MSAQNASYGQNGAGGPGGGTHQAVAQPQVYLCADCAAENPIRMGEPIRCRECGHRVMYKPRTKRSVQFEAR
ncbi:DNA directed RNA polymerase [Mrakia frigida]|uniref:DNA-directed RNA polymerase core subunit RPC10 n=1 Tax=Mrakia frigida TaxID=29902 RepID=UPI003FCBEFF4